ncbi:MAG: FRG domain-containing protein [Phycisphaerae bacterium]|nr:FRG domain-containing protein [Phycisphaerae bacterium]
MPDAASAALCLHLDQEISLQACGCPKVYRGQADVDGWTIQPSIDRFMKSDVREHLRQLYAATIFALVLYEINWYASERFEKAWHLDQNTAMSMARHHGFASPLIDFTTDPSLAVIMAHKQAVCGNAEFACVYSFEVDNDEFKFTSTIPPPPMLRSARQHAVYYSSQVPGDEPNIGGSYKIRFPASSKMLGDTALLRDSKETDIFHADPLLSRLELIVRDLMRTMPVAAISYESAELANPKMVPDSLKQFAKSILLTLVDEKLLSDEDGRFRYCSPDEATREWFLVVTDILHSLLGVQWHDAGKFSFRSSMINRFVRDNWITVQIYLYIFMTRCRGTPLESLKTIIKPLNTRILEISDGRCGVIDRELIMEGATLEIGKGITWNKVER